MSEQNDQPRRIGPYLTERLLGEGGMGRVHLARPADDPSAPPVALKVVHPYLARDPEFRARFQREVTVARAVSSRHVVPVVDADPLADEPWLAGAYVPGPTLERVVADGGPLPEDRLRALAVALASALADIHAAGLVHRDLKPSNVLMHPGHGPQVIDFGIARAIDGTRLTATGAVLGTPGFMPPELFREGTSGAAGDVFALGAVLAYAATGRRPFGTGSAPQVGLRTLSAEPDLDGVPEGLLPLVRACLSKDPAARPSPREVIRAADPSARPPRTLGGLRRGRAAMAAAVAIAVAVAMGVLVVHGMASSDGDRNGRTRKAAATVPPLPAPTSPLNGLADTVRMSRAWQDYTEFRRRGNEPFPDESNEYAREVWLTDDIMVRVGRDAVRGIDPSNGEVRWTLAPPAPGMVPCRASRTVSQGVGAVVFGRPDGDDGVEGCDQVVAVSLGAGRALWRRRSVDEPYVGSRLRFSESVGISGGRVLVETDQHVTAYRLGDGRVMWRRARDAGGCTLSGIVIGESTYAEALNCPPKGVRTWDRPAWVRSVNSADGRVRWTARVPGDVPVYYLETAEPVSVSLHGAQEPDPGPLLVFDDRGRPGVRVGTAQGIGSERNNTPPVRMVLGWKDTVIVADRENRTDGASASVTAIDSRTGRVRWRYRLRAAWNPLLAGVDDRGAVIVELRNDLAKRRPMLTRLSLDRGLPSRLGSLEGPLMDTSEFRVARMTGRHLAVFTDYSSLLARGLVMYAAKTA